MYIYIHRSIYIYILISIIQFVHIYEHICSRYVFLSLWLPRCSNNTFGTYHLPSFLESPPQIPADPWHSSVGEMGTLKPSKERMGDWYPPKVYYHGNFLGGASLGEGGTLNSHETSWCQKGVLHEGTSILLNTKRRCINLIVWSMVPNEQRAKSWWRPHPDWFIGILLLAYYNPYIAPEEYNPIQQITKSQGQ